MATPRAAASTERRRIVSSSPAWNPHAMLALVMLASSASSPGIPSPTSAFRSTLGTFGHVRCQTQKRKCDFFLRAELEFRLVAALAAWTCPVSDTGLKRVVLGGGA